MALNTYTLENLTLREIPPVWVKKFHLQPGQCFTVRITSEDVSVPMPITKPVSMQKERVALMREIEKQLSGTEYEDSEELIKAIKETRTISEPKQIF
jgi:ABC-type molybdate transport system ATPase subunit